MIVLVRVDHRLLHGQVVFTWTKSISTDCILIASDAVVKDELRMTALRLSKPNGVKLVMKSIDDSIKALNAGVKERVRKDGFISTNIIDYIGSCFWLRS